MTVIVIKVHILVLLPKLKVIINSNFKTDELPHTHTHTHVCTHIHTNTHTFSEDFLHFHRRMNFTVFNKATFLHGNQRTKIKSA